MRFDVERPWVLDPQVSLRPESFGALAYHFGTRRLSFLKDRTLVRVVEGLASCATARDACRAAGVEPAQERAIVQALGTLAATGMIVERSV